MDWPWQRRSSPATADSPRVPAAGWAFLPPLQRQLSDEPPLTLVPTFESWLPTRAVPQRMGAMGHLVTPGAPAGTVAGTTAQLGLPVQRAVATDLTLRPPSWDRPRTGHTPQPTVARVALGGRASVGPEAGPATPPTAQEPMPLTAVPEDSSTEGQPDAADTDPSTDPQLAGSTPEDVPDAESADAGATEAEAGLLGERHPAGTLSPTGTHPPGAGTGPTLQRHERHPPQPAGATAPPMSSPGMRRLGLGAPVKPPAQPVMPSLQRADMSVPSAPVPPPAAVPGAAAQSRPSSSPLDIAEATAAAPVSPGGGSVDEETVGTNASTITSSPAPEILVSATRDTAPHAQEPREAAPHGPAPLLLPRVQRSGDGVGEGSDASDIGRRWEPSTDRADAQAATVRTVPLVAQRALAPMLSPVTMARPVQRQHPHASVLVDIDGRPPASATTSPPPGRAAPANAPAPLRTTINAPRGGLVNWLQRLAGTEGIRPPDTASAAAGGSASGSADARLGTLQPSSASRSTRSQSPGGGSIQPRAYAGGTNAQSAVQRAVWNAQPSSRAADGASPGGVASRLLQRLTGRGEPGSPELASGLPGASLAGMARTRLVTALPPVTPREAAASGDPDGDDGRMESGADADAEWTASGTSTGWLAPTASASPTDSTDPASWTGPADSRIWTGSTGLTASTGWTASTGSTGSTPAIQRSAVSAVPARRTPPLLGGVPLNRVPARVAVQAVAPPTVDRAPMPVAVAPLGSAEQHSAGTASADAPVPAGSTPASVQRAEAPETASAPVADPGEPPAGGEEVPAAGTPSGTVPGTATATAATAAAAATAVSPAVIETLAGQLYGPLVRRLRAELLLDRERRGLRIDGV